MLVVKLNENSLKNSESLNNLKNIVENESQNSILIVSALKDVNRYLNKMFDIAIEKGEGYMPLLRKVELIHLDIAKSVLPLNKQTVCISNIKFSISCIENVLNCMTVLKNSKNSKARSRDYILSYGELLASQILESMLDDSIFVDAKDMFVTDDNFGAASILRDESEYKIKMALESSNGISIVNGFSGKTRDGYRARLKRDVIDQSADLIAYVLNVDVFEI